MSILRSVVEFDGLISQEDLVRNFQYLRTVIETGRFTWGRPEDDKIYKFALSFFVQHFEMPSAQSIIDEFRKTDSIEEIERLKSLANDPPYKQANFVHLVKETQEKQAIEHVKTFLENTEKIMVKGAIDKKNNKTLKGLNDALEYFSEKSRSVQLVDDSAQIIGDIRDDAEAMKEEYELAERDKGKVYGVLSGIDEIDEACKGAKKGELWIHAAFPGELKSTLACNWAYNAVTRYKKNVVYFSFEMPRHQIRRNIYTLHTTHSKFAKQGYKPLDYRAIRDGNLTPEEKDFYFNHVIPDFDQCEDYTHFEVVTPDRGWSLGDIRSQLNIFQKEFDVGLVIFDHGQWIKAERTNKDYTIELNSIVNDSKQLALQFNKNEGLAVMMLFQINRTGKIEADKNDGVYKLNALTYANACCTEDTLVSTSSGLLPIKDVPVGSEVWSSTGWKTVLRNLDNGEKPVVEVETDRGVAIRVTEDHRFRVLGEEGLEWVEARNLEGQYVLGCSNLSQDSSTSIGVDLDFQAWERQAKEDTPITAPREMTPELAYLLGAHAGDGLLRKYHIGFCGNLEEKAVKERVQTYFQKVFGHTLIESNRPSTFSLKFYSTSLVRWFQEIGSDRKGGVPECVLRSSESCVTEFLKGFWDADGHVNTQGVISVGQEIAKKKTLEEVQLLCRSIGIDTTIREKKETLKGKEHIQAILYVRSRISRRRFAEKIGFTEPHKATRLSSFVKGLEDSTRRATKEEWPVKNLYRCLVETYGWVGIRQMQQKVYRTLLLSEKPLTLKEIANRVSSGNSQKAHSATTSLVERGYITRIDRGLYKVACDEKMRTTLPRKCWVAYRDPSSLVPRGCLEAMIEVFDEEGIQDENVEVLRCLLANTMPQKVISVTAAGVDRVRDLEVTGDHEYATGGLLTHNCEKSADIITASYLNDDLRRQGLVKFTNMKNRDNPLFDPFEAHVEWPPKKLRSKKHVDGLGAGWSEDGHDAWIGGMDDMDLMTL